MAGNIDLTEDPSIDLMLASNIGQALGNIFDPFGQRKRAIEGEKVALESDKLLKQQREINLEQDKQRFEWEKNAEAKKKRNEIAQRTLIGILASDEFGKLANRNDKYNHLIKKMNENVESEYGDYLYEQMMKDAFEKPEEEQFTLGGAGTPEVRYRIRPYETEAKEIARGPIPPVKPQAGKGQTYQNENGEYRYGLFNTVSGELIKDLRKATEEDIKQAKLEQMGAQTELTRQRTEIDALKLELAQQKQALTEAKTNADIKRIDTSIDNLKSQIKTREDTLELKKQEPENINEILSQLRYWQQVKKDSEGDSFIVEGERFGEIKSPDDYKEAEIRISELEEKLKKSRAKIVSPLSAASEIKNLDPLGIR